MRKSTCTDVLPATPGISTLKLVRAGLRKSVTSATCQLLPTLTKNGYRVAYRQFRVVLMPRPKFLLGTYYSDYNITVLENRLVLQFSKAYTSKAPTFYPAKHLCAYALKSIEKNGVLFVDTYKIFSVDPATGKITVALNTVLTAGEYKVTCKPRLPPG